MNRRIALLVAAFLTAICAVAPVASASPHRQHGHHLSVHMRGLVGTVDASSQLPGTLVLTTKRHGNVTITNPKNVDTSAVKVGDTVVVRVRAKWGTGNTIDLTLISIRVFKPRVKPYAVVDAVGPVTIGDGSITVATITFKLAPGKTLPKGLVDGKLVAVRGIEKTATDALTIKRLAWRHHARTHGPRVVRAWARLLGPVTGLTVATDTTAGSLEVANIALVIPAGKTLPAKVVAGARVQAIAKVKNGVLTLARVCAKRNAAAPATV